MSSPSTAILKPLKKVKLSDFVTEEIERLILDNTFKEGDALPSERELMAAFDVGRPSVREALQNLAQRGLVEIKSGEKTRVTRPCTQTIVSGLSGIAIGLLSQDKEKMQFEHLRQLFEIAIIREAARIRTDADIESLSQALENNLAQVNNYDRFIETDIAFHMAIIGILDNPMLTTIYESLIQWLIRSRNPETFAALHKDSCDHHVKIFDAIKQGDPDLAEHEMRLHLDNVMNNA
ncbi:FCD domain-containing protein [Photobacterium makurazakiensis]|uniref:FCD domain-containing protein n=1 Tax=Photobacterium makurazakiensis TaxID=2910234 RepID=UPI003D140DBE